MKKLALGLALLIVGLGLSGTAAVGQIMLPVISVEPASVDFGSVPVGALAHADIVVYNLSPDTPLSVKAVKTKAPFGDNATSFTVPPNGSRRVTITFAPSAPGTYNDVCTILSNAHNAPTLNVPLSGTGVE